jgi:hypothetical protein
MAHEVKRYMAECDEDECPWHGVYDSQRLAELAEADHASGEHGGARSIEDHITGLTPRDTAVLLSDHDRRQIARAVVDAWIVGTAWITRDPATGFARRDPLTIDVMERRM